MRELLVAATCMLAELAVAGLRPRSPRPEHVRSNLARFSEPYFLAFLARCLACVYSRSEPPAAERREQQLDRRQPAGGSHDDAGSSTA